MISDVAFRRQYTADTRRGRNASSHSPGDASPPSFFCSREVLSAGRQQIRTANPRTHSSLGSRFSQPSQHKTTQNPTRPKTTMRNGRRSLSCWRSTIRGRARVRCTRKEGGSTTDSRPVGAGRDLLDAAAPEDLKTVQLNSTCRHSAMCDLMVIKWLQRSSLLACLRAYNRCLQYPLL